MATSTVSNRADAERDVISELQAWRRYAVPESAPLDAEDVARLVRACFDALGIDAEVGADFSVNTVHYYRRKHILDEPTRGIDVGAKFEIYGIIQELARTGRGVLVISSELPELLGLCDRIYTLAEGVITREFDRSEATQESLMRYMTVDAR